MPAFLRSIARFALTALLVYAGLVVAVWLMQNRLLYQPGVGGYDYVGTPDNIGLEWQSVTLNTEDDLKLNAWWLPAKDTRARLLFFHGNAGNISHRLHSLAQFNQLGLSVLIIDYRGYGKSEGKPSEKGTALDATAAWQWLNTHSSDEQGPVIVFGRSLGAAVAAELAQRKPVDGVILESPFQSVPSIGQQIYPFLPVRLLARLNYPVVEYVKGIHAPVLVIHSRDDRIIPFSQGKAVYQAAQQPKRMLVLRGGHNTAFITSEYSYLEGINNFLHEVAEMKSAEP